MPILSNGDVIPSFLEPEYTKRAWDGGFLDEIRLLRGEVKDVIYPTDVRSRGKRSVEYVVFAQRKSNGSDLSQEFRCVNSTAFGGVADKFTYTLRKDNTDNKNQEGIGTGSKVLFLCINGEKTRGIILTGVKDDNDGPDTDAKDLGLNLHFIFNGISFDINKDGELTATYGGATAIDGTTSVAKSVSGSTIQLLKNGNINIADNSNRNQVLVDHEGDRVVISGNSGLIQLNDDGIVATTQNGAMINFDASSSNPSVSIFDPSGNSLALNKNGITGVDSAGSSIVLSGDGTAQVAADSVIVTGSQVDVVCGSGTFGQNADSFMVRGDQLKTLLLTLTAALTAFTTGLNPGTLAAQAVTLNSAIAPIITLINTTMLSQSNKVK